MGEASNGGRGDLELARKEFQRHDWPAAAEAYARADAAAPLGAADLERYGEAVWWLARLEDAIAVRERAHSAHLKEGDRVAAARVALWLVVDYLSRLRHTLAAGALARAERLLADETLGRAHAHLALVRAFRAHDAGDAEAAQAFAREGEALSSQFGDRDLETIALILQGRAAVSLGDVEQGLELMDRATVTAVGDELQPLTTGLVYCMTIGACADLGDYARAGEWTEAAEQWCARQAMPSGFPGICRVHRAAVKRMGGEWAQAEEEARRAAAELQDSFLDTAGAAYYEIGEIRLRQGDLEAAEEALHQAHAYGHEAQPGIALLRLAQGRLDAAVSGITAALDNPFLQPLGRARLLPALVRIMVAAGNHDTAAEAARELEALAERYASPSPVLPATARIEHARVALAQGDSTGALASLRLALRDWHKVRAPYEVATVRALMAEAHLAAGDRDAATFEARAARMTFERLGAVLDARRTAALLTPRAAVDHPVRTFLFSDIVTSTDLVDLIGDDAWADLVRWHDRALREQFAAHGGEEVDHAGDGFFVAFEDPRQAVACAQAIQRRLLQHRRESGFAPRVRIGLHAAEAVRDADGYVGRGVHTAARIAALAAGGEILASRAALEAAGAAADGWRTVTLKGISEAVDVAPVDWEQPA